MQKLGIMKKNKKQKPLSPENQELVEKVEKAKKKLKRYYKENNLDPKVDYSNDKVHGKEVKKYMKLIEASRVKLGNVLAKDPSKKDVVLDRKDVKVEDPSKEKNPSKKKVVTKPSKYDYPKIKSDNGKEREMTSNEK